MEYRPRSGRSGLHALSKYLADFYEGHHRVVLYEASPLRLFKPGIRSTTIDGLPTAGVKGGMTLHIPPKPRRPDAEGLRAQTVRSESGDCPT